MYFLISILSARHTNIVVVNPILIRTNQNNTLIKHGDKRMPKTAKPVEIIVHINDKLQSTQINNLESSLSNNNGITNARFNPTRNHLMRVDYMPSVVSAREVLGYVKNHGYQAALVGG